MTDFPITVESLIRQWALAEEWRQVEGYPNYHVSSYGAVQGPRALLRPTVFLGYQIVSLVRDGKTKNYKVHRLVAEAFLGLPPFEGAMVAHNDGNRSNNNISNLRWASALENQKDRRRHGTWRRGSEISWSKLKEDDIPIIRERIKRGEKYDDIGLDYGVSKHTIHRIKKGDVWKHVSGAAWGTDHGKSWQQRTGDAD